MLSTEIETLKSILKRHLHGNDAQKKEALDELKRYGLNSTAEAYAVIRKSNGKTKVFKCKCHNVNCIDDDPIQRCQGAVLHG